MCGRSHKQEGIQLNFNGWILSRGFLQRMELISLFKKKPSFIIISSAKEVMFSPLSFCLLCIRNRRQIEEFLFSFFEIERYSVFKREMIEFKKTGFFCRPTRSTELFMLLGLHYF